jgi:anaerobic selenocysteine-containing dehydrogenase
LEKRTLCSGCPARCSLIIETDNGRPVAVRADKEQPKGPSLACRRGRAYVLERTNHPERILYPLKRQGERGSGKWRRISWDQALEEIATRLREIKDRYGAETVVGTPSEGRSFEWAMRRFLNLLGSPNSASDGAVCFIDALRIDQVTFGWLAITDETSKTKCTVVLGGNLPVIRPQLYPAIKRAKEKEGMKIIHIDPRFTETSKIADLWLPIRPGTDGALLLCWLNTIIQEELYDKDFVEQWTNAPYLVRSDTNKLLRDSDIKAEGDPEKFLVWDTVSRKPVAFDRETLSYETPDVKPALYGAHVVMLANGKRAECKTAWQLLKERVAPYTAERAAEITWVPADTILDAIRMYVTNKPAVFGRLGNAVDGSGKNTCQTYRSRDIIRAITGNLSEGGGEVVPSGHSTKMRFLSELEANDQLPPEQKRKRLVKFGLSSWESYEERFKYQKKAGIAHPLQSAQECAVPTHTLWPAILTGKPYQVKAFVIICNNPLVSSSNTSLVYEALRNLDLLVVSEIFMTPTAEQADYVLPAASMGTETPLLSRRFDISSDIASGYQALEPPGECWSDFKFLRELGVRMGQHWPWKTLEEVYDWQLEPMGYTWEDFVEKVHWVVPPPEPRQYEKNGFGTPSGKVEIYSSYLEKLGYDPLPSYEELPESPVSTPELAKEYPLIMSSIRRRHFYNTEGQQLESIRNTHPDPLVLIHPEMAASLGISEGDWVWIESPLGKKIKQRAKLFDGTHPNFVYPDQLWYYPQGNWESNINVIINDAEEFCDPMLGSWPFNGLLCKIYKLTELSEG